MVAAKDGTFSLGPLGIGGEDDRGDEAEWRLFEHLAALEEWTGEPVDVPDRVGDEMATRIAQAALWVRALHLGRSVVRMHSRSRVGERAADGTVPVAAQTPPRDVARTPGPPADG